eukprot:7382700-Prymnesium_polylepis.1
MPSSCSCATDTCQEGRAATQRRRCPGQTVLRSCKRSCSTQGSWATRTESARESRVVAESPLHRPASAGVSSRQTLGSWLTGQCSKEVSGSNLCRPHQSV